MQRSASRTVERRGRRSQPTGACRGTRRVRSCVDDCSQVVLETGTVEMAARLLEMLPRASAADAVAGTSGGEQASPDLGLGSCVLGVGLQTSGNGERAVPPARRGTDASGVPAARARGAEDLGL